MNLEFLAKQDGISCYFIREGNNAFVRHDFAQAIEYFELAKKSMPQFAKLIERNIHIAKHKQKSIYLKAPVQPQKKIDIVVPVYNALEDVKKCLQSLENHTDGFMVHIFVINDASEHKTTQWLQDFCKGKTLFSLIINSENLGYTKTVNIGLRASTADYVITQNSDTIVTEGWLRGLVRCMESNENIGIVGPLGNAAGWQSVPKVKETNMSGFFVNELPQNITLSQFAKLVSITSKKKYPRIPIINGFCFMIKRDVINTIGYMDEKSFPKGYGEEEDYCFRAAEEKFATAVADDVYIYHAKSKSFGEEQRSILSYTGFQKNIEKYTHEKLVKKNRYCSENIQLHEIRSNIESIYTKSNLSIIFGKKILVHLHLFYHNQLDFFLKKLKNITVDFDLFVTVTEETIDTQNKILSFKKDAKIILVDNTGFDIFPFWKILQNVNLIDYDYVLKIHTKNYREKAWHNNNVKFLGFEWRNTLVDAFLFDESKFNSSLKVFENMPHVGMIAGRNLVRSYENAAQVKNTEKLCEKMNIKYHKFANFVCGTMFLVRSNLLEKFKETPFTHSDFCDEKHHTGSVGTLAHSLETVFGILLQNKNMYIYENPLAYNANTKKFDQEVKLVMNLVVKNEEDIIEKNIRFHSAMGVDGFIVIDHNSTDNTNNILQKLKNEGLVLEILKKYDPEHKLQIWVTEMINLAKHKYGATWVINSDADEFYYSKQLNLKESIIKSTGANVLWIDSHLVFPDNRENYLETPYFFSKMLQPFEQEILNIKDTNSFGIYNDFLICPKVIHNTADFISIKGGNHDVTMNNKIMHKSADIILYHFHVKNYREFEKKIIRWKDAAKLKPEGNGWHLKKMIEIYEEGKLKQYYDERYNADKRDFLIANGIVVIDKSFYMFMQMINIQNKKDTFKTCHIATQSAYNTFYKNEIVNRKNFELKAINGLTYPSIVKNDFFCIACDKKTTMKSNWRLDTPDNNFIVWQNQVRCQNCNLSNRFRAAIHVLNHNFGYLKTKNVYITEQTTNFFNYLKNNFNKNIIGSEFLGNVCPLGSKKDNILNQDLTQLTFESHSFDAVLSFDVFEHIPNYRKALSEVYRVLSKGGVFFFTIPFHLDKETTVTRAKIMENGEIYHIHPPVYHGDPLKPEGILCFHDFAWDFFDECRKVGFKNCSSIDYWSDYFGYLGNKTIFVAYK